MVLSREKTEIRDDGVAALRHPKEDNPQFPGALLMNTKLPKKDARMTGPPGYTPAQHLEHGGKRAFLSGVMAAVAGGALAANTVKRKLAEKNEQAGDDNATSLLSFLTS
eukprot:NODE_16565_length_988_cov_1.148664.p2 GENE.NODE_16565_length_988_cov_1.148664~~NODE_16565_length_988_cov_1.148664.p2  ORF type:complete len:109 (+),score=36.61 NODE_16565_length_988_cov_1.148664:478-804(+)